MTPASHGQFSILRRFAALTTPRDSKDVCEITACVGRLLGYVDARIASLGVLRQHTEQQEYDRAIRVISDEIGTETLVKLMALGAAMSEDRAVEYALSI